MEYAVEMKGITKTFPGIIANDNIDLSVRKGEIHAILGENGAGKSTLMSVLFGFYKPDKGEILINGKKVNIKSPSDAFRYGVGMVHQHFQLVQNFTVTENIVLGAEPTKNGVLDIDTARKKVAALSEKYGLNVDVDAKIEDISVGMQQRVEILKVLYRNADIVILDEPTAVLTPQEIEELIDIMRTFIKEGKSVILITHKLKEIMMVSDRCSVLRRGKYIGTVDIENTSEKDLAEMMVGREVNFKVDKEDMKTGKVILDIKDLRVTNSRGIEAIKGLSLQVREGEILGIAGIDGNGQSELVEAISGLKKADSGTILINGEDITNISIRERAEHGLGHIPEDRQKHGLVLEFNLGENLLLQKYYREPYQNKGIINFQEVDKKAKQLIKDFDVRCANEEKTIVRSMSGGNQQKAIIAREVDIEPKILVASQPTRGLDVGAIEYIHKRLVDIRNEKKAVLLISFELDEILSVSDRIAVIYEGTIVGVVDPEDTNENELGLMMSGSKEVKHEKEQ